MEQARESTRSEAIGRIRNTAFDRHPALGSVRAYLEQNVARPMTLSIAARVAGLNAKYFSALFHARIGVRFIDWLHWVRTERAKQMLDDTDHSIAEIAILVGYNDLRTFERAFKKCNGQTAQRHRKRRAALPRPAAGERPPLEPLP